MTRKRNGHANMKAPAKDGHLHIRVAKATLERWRTKAQGERRSLANWVECQLDKAAEDA
ncbi:MAG: hypothetical protein Q8S13_05930 [Dehalococcoidia bacterium]|nr:hypothetical protein [Dehalococcoidia bacterium]